MVIYLIINIKKTTIYLKNHNMAKSNTSSNSSVKLTTSKVSRPGVHSKKSSNIKSSKNYKKRYAGQGRRR